MDSLTAALAASHASEVAFGARLTEPLRVLMFRPQNQDAPMKDQLTYD